MKAHRKTLSAQQDAFQLVHVEIFGCCCDAQRMHRVSVADSLRLFCLQLDKMKISFNCNKNVI